MNGILPNVPNVETRLRFTSFTLMQRLGEGQAFERSLMIRANGSTVVKQLAHSCPLKSCDTAQRSAAKTSAEGFSPALLTFLSSVFRFDEAALSIQKEKNIYKEIENYPTCYKVFFENA
jgi:hypothetical protein